MIRLVIFLVFLFLIWVLFFSGFERRRKIIISVVAVLLCALGFWFDGYDKRELRTLIGSDEIVSCGVTAKHSYRTNFNVTICLSNNAERGTLTRLNMLVSAARCAEGADFANCDVLQQTHRDIAVNVPAKSSSTIEQNLAFDLVPTNDDGIQWFVEVVSTKAVR